MSRVDCSTKDRSFFDVGIALQSGLYFFWRDNFSGYFELSIQSTMKNKLATNQIEISLAEISPFTNGDMAFHQRQGDPMMAWSPLGGGSLMTDTSDLGATMYVIAAQHGVDRTAIAVAFLLSHPAKILPVLGTNNLDRIARISDALKVELDRQSWFQLYQAALGYEVA